MFEDATFESMVTIHTRSRNWMAATFGVNASILGLMAAIPFIYPSALPQVMNAWLMEAPAPVEEARPVVRQTRAVAEPSEIYDGRVVAPRQIPAGTWIPDRGADGDPAGVVGLDLSGNAGAENPFGQGIARTVVQQAAQPAPHISSGVMEGMLIARVLPVYPAAALAMRVAGRVELQATISRTGTIENLRAVSGPALLQQATLDAVKQWRYRPYLLNGQPVEVETTINVDFRLE